MNKAPLCFLLLLSLLTFTQAGHFKKLHFQKGVTQDIRNLDTALPSTNFYETILPKHAVGADFGQAYHNTTGNTDIPGMLILLYSSDTVLTDGTSGVTELKAYNCTAPCSINKTINTTANLPFQQVASYNPEIGQNVKLSILNGSWSLATPANFLYQWEDTMNYFPHNLLYGWIGLGAAGSAIANFPNSSPLFSVIFTDFVQGNGTIIFGNQTSYCNTTVYSASHVSTANWEIAVDSLSSSDGTKYTNVSAATLVFDLQFGVDDQKYIALPADYHDTIRSALLKISGVQCPTSVECVYMGTNLSVLPTFILNTASGSQFQLDPSIYMYDYEVNGGYYTAFVSQPPIATGQVPNIVLGWPFMRNYYTVFSNNMGISTIQLYYNPAPRIDVPNPPNPADTGDTTDDDSASTGGDSTPVTPPTQPTSDDTTPPATTPSSGGGHGVLISILVLIVVIAGVILYVKIRRAKAAARNAADGLDAHLDSNRSPENISSIRM